MKPLWRETRVRQREGERNERVELKREEKKLNISHNEPRAKHDGRAG